jgi:serine-type D-Ala-D-Ala carboxypeptidase/endopeptidase
MRFSCSTFLILLILPLTIARAADSIHQAVDHLLLPIIDSHTAPSGIVAVVTADSTRYFSYGHLSSSDPAPPTRATLFEIGSLTKLFTATLLADAMQRKEVHIKDTVQSILPDVKIPTRHQKQITLEHLATHTSGLPRIPLVLRLKSLDDPYADENEQRLYGVLDGLVLKSDPGKTSRYSNLGFALLGNALSHKLNDDYESLIIRRICDPLNLPDTRITLSESQQHRLAPGHRDGEIAPYWHFTAYAPCGALHSTAADLARFLRANMNLDKTPLAETLAVARRPRFTMDKDADPRIGLAWMTQPLDDTTDTLTWHNGGTGGFSSFLGFSNEHHIGVILLFNSLHRRRLRNHRRLRAAQSIDHERCPAQPFNKLERFVSSRSSTVCRVRFSAPVILLGKKLVW